MSIKYSTTDDKPRKLFRTISNNSKELNYFAENNKIFGKCHWGQRKLFFSEMEFFSMIAKHHDLSKYLVVYIGAATGSHTQELLNYFPELNYLLYDPNKFDIKPDKRIIIKTGKDGFFTDDKVDEVLKIADGRKIIYISDIRLEAKEEVIMNDMFYQQRWGINMNADFMMLKMRLPYYYGDNKGKIFVDEKLDNARLKILNNKSPNTMLYLDGQIFLQIYPPTNSTETRLMLKKNKDGTYNMKYHDFKKYDGQLNYYNKYDRMSNYKFKESEQLKYHLLGYDDSIQIATEYYLIYIYYKYYKKRKTNLSEIVNTLFNLNKYFEKKHNKDIITCIFETATNKLSMREDDDKYKTFVKTYKEYITGIIKSLSTQIDYIKKSNILTDEQKIYFRKQYDSILIKLYDERDKINDI